MSDECFNRLKKIEKITGQYEYVLSTEKDTQQEYHNLLKTFKAILKRAGMDKAGKNGINKMYGLHSLSHTFATILINERKANIVYFLNIRSKNLKYVLETSLKKKETDKLNEKIQFKSVNTKYKFNKNNSTKRQFDNTNFDNYFIALISENPKFYKHLIETINYNKNL